MRTIIITGLLGMARLLVLSQSASDTNYFERVLRSAPAAEMPAAAASLVTRAAPAERFTTAAHVVRIAVRINPAATLPVVSALSRAEPGVAAVVSEIASAEQPLLVEQITRCAAATIPARAGEIVVRIGRLAPENLRNVAAAAALSAPGENRDILRAIAVVRPELKTYLEQEINRWGRSLPPVVRSFDRAEQAHLRAATGHDEPLRLNSPDRPVSKPPRGDGKPPGGRNYAKP
jgi:hypothetical protein